MVFLCLLILFLKVLVVIVCGYMCFRVEIRVRVKVNCCFFFFGWLGICRYLLRVYGYIMKYFFLIVVFRRVFNILCFILKYEITVDDKRMRIEKVWK